MRIKLRWVVAMPFAVLALDMAVGYLLVHLANRGFDDTVYWGTWLPWLWEAIAIVAACACLIVVLVGVLFVGPAVLVRGLLNRWPTDLGRGIRDTPEQRRAFEQ